MSMSKRKDRNTAWMATSVENALAAAVARAIEKRHMSISDAIGTGLSMWLELVGESELAAMMADGRGTVPRCHLRHK